MTLDLVLDIGSSALNEVRIEPNGSLPRDLRKGCLCSQELLEVPAHQTAESSRQTVPRLCVSSASVVLPPQSSLCPRLVVPLSPAHHDGLVWEIRTFPLSFPLFLPPKTHNLIWNSDSAVLERSSFMHKSHYFTRSFQRVHQG